MVSKRIFISGITGGIGAALARRLHGLGWTVGGCARSAERLQALEAELPGLWTAKADVTDAEALAAAVADFSKQAGGLDGLAHAVGSIFLKPAHLTSLAEFRATLEINLVSAFIALKAAVPLLQANGSGSIVLFSSTAAQTGLQSHESISAAKAGIEGLVRAAAATYAPRNIRVNAIAPGLVETPLSAGLLSSEPARQASEKMHPLGRIGKPEDIAAAAALLLSDEASWITGQTWPVDGGLADLRVRR